MTTRRFTGTRYLVAVLTATLAGVLGAPAAATAGTTQRGSSCLDTLHLATAVPERLTTAWAASDAAGVAGTFAGGGALVDTRGQLSTGRRVIQERFEIAFDTYLKGTRPELTVTRARCVSDDVAIMNVVGGLVFPGESEPRPDTDQLQTWVLQRHGHRWAVAALQATLNNPGGPHPDGPDPTGASQSMATDERSGRSCRADTDAVRAVPERRILDAWQANDPAAFAALLTPNGHFIVGDGTFLTGRLELRRYMETVFEAVPGVTATATALDVTCLDRTVGVVHTAGGLLLPGETEVPPERRGSQTWVITRFGGDWLIDAYQNTRIAP